MASIWDRAFFFAAVLTGVGMAPVAAQQPLPVEAGKAWTHKNSGITIPPALDELPRVRATSFAAPELDISQSFASEDGRESLTVYIFRNTNGAVPVWFAQSERAILLREDLGKPPLGVGPVAFAPPGQSVPSGLKAVFAPVEVEGIRSTGVALFAVGDWYVKLRANSATLTSPDMSYWMDEVLKEIKFPRTAPAVAAEPLTPCAPPLAFGETAGDSKLSAATMTIGVSAPAPRQTATRWCLDSVVSGNRAVYRPDGARDRYLLAMGDNGKAIAVQDQAPGGYHSVNFITAAQTYVLFAQDRMPSPARIAELVAGERVLGTAATWPPN